MVLTTLQQPPRCVKQRWDVYVHVFVSVCVCIGYVINDTRARRGGLTLNLSTLLGLVLQNLTAN